MATMQSRTGANSAIGLDYFGARYYSGAQGRFTSPDKPFADQFVAEPQSWNLYSYVRNNPLRYIDDDGRGAREIWFGLTNAVSSNAGAVRRVDSVDSDVRFGQRIGDVVSFAGGLIEMAGGGVSAGGGAAACGTGVLCPAGAAAVVGGTALAMHGALLTGNATLNLMSSVNDAPGDSANAGNTQAEPQKSSGKRPDGVPEHWTEQPSKKGGGTVYVNPKNPHERVRVMPGNPNSPNPAQQQPYMKRQKNGRFFDREGREVPGDSPDAHIPIG
jgi:RHS repeat-associated protein